MLDEFEKQNPDIKIEMETTPWDQYWVKLEAGQWEVICQM